MIGLHKPGSLVHAEGFGVGRVLMYLGADMWRIKFPTGLEATVRTGRIREATAEERDAYETRPARRPARR